MCIKHPAYIYVASTMDTFNVDSFRALDVNPGGTLQHFQAYIERMELLFQLVFRKADGTAYKPSDAEKKAMLLFKGGEDMKTLFSMSERFWIPIRMNRQFWKLLMVYQNELKRLFKGTLKFSPRVKIFQKVVPGSRQCSKNDQLWQLRLATSSSWCYHSSNV